MKLPRFSIAKMLGLVAWCGVAFASLRFPSPLWASALLSGAIALLVFAVLAIIYRTGLKRAYWVGMAICGGTYACLAFAPGLADRFEPGLITTAMLDCGYLRLAPKTSLNQYLVQNPQFASWALPALPAVVATPSGTMPGQPLPLPAPPSSGIPIVSTANNGVTGFIYVTTANPGLDSWTAWTQPDRVMQGGLWPVSSGIPPASSSTTFRAIGHALFIFLIGHVGGLVARGLRGKPSES